MSNHEQQTVVQDTVQCTVNGIDLERTNTWTVKWGDTPNCTCNGLVYGGMPCKHLICVAIHEHHQIPLQCFNKIFWVRDPVIRPEHPNPDPDHGDPDPDHGPSEQPPMDLDTPTSSEQSTQEQQDQIHMKWASIMSKFNDPVSCQTIGTMQCLIYQILESHQYAPQEMNRLMERIKQDVDQTIREINRNHSQQVGVLTHPQAPVTANSYRTVPQTVQRALTDALQTAPVVTQPSPQPKRKRTRRA